MTLQSDKISHIDTVIFHIDTVIFHIDTVILRSSSISMLSSCHLVDRMTRSYLVTLPARYTRSVGNAWMCCSLHSCLLASIVQSTVASAAASQGLTLVHCSAQRKHFLGE